MRQIWIYWTAAPDTGERTTMTPAEARDFAGRKQREKEAWIRRTWEDLRRGV